MGLHSPFGYVNYEIQMSEIFVDILDKLCAHCHANDDYSGGCRGCPAGNLVFECKEYILDAIESDKTFELYASDEWLLRAVRRPTEEEREKDRQIALDYKPECEVLRAMKKRVKSIRPHPFLYVRGGKRGHRRPKNLAEFAELTLRLKKVQTERLQRWGIMPVKAV